MIWQKEEIEEAGVRGSAGAEYANGSRQVFFLNIYFFLLSMWIIMDNSFQ